jgi:hypothetical protein
MASNHLRGKAGLFRYGLLILLQLALSASCLAQSTDHQDKNENEDGRFLLDLNYSDTVAIEGVTDIFGAGLTWLIRPYLRVGADTSFVDFTPATSSKLASNDQQSARGLGDSTFFIQYDWQERLTASPWIPDNVGTSLAVLVPTGNARESLGGDTWAASVAVSWPVVIKGGWLINPAINYNFTFNEGPLADHISVAEASLGIVKLFPASFWIGITPSYWYDLDLKTWNFDGHFTIGKMFSNGLGVGLDYGQLARHYKPHATDDKSLLLNLFFQFGRNNGN